MFWLVVCVNRFFGLDPVQGGVLGLLIGIGQGLFSAGGFWLNLIIKGLIGMAAGFVAKNLTNMTPATIFFPLITFSIVSSVVFAASSGFGMPLRDMLEVVPSQVLPQALLEGLLGVGLNWILTHLNRNTFALGWVKTNKGYQVTTKSPYNWRDTNRPYA